MRRMPKTLSTLCALTFAEKFRIFLAEKLYWRPCDLRRPDTWSFFLICLMMLLLYVHVTAVFFNLINWWQQNKYQRKDYQQLWNDVDAANRACMRNAFVLRHRSMNVCMILMEKKWKKPRKWKFQRSALIIKRTHPFDAHGSKNEIRMQRILCWRWKWKRIDSSQIEFINIGWTSYIKYLSRWTLRDEKERKYKYLSTWVHRRKHTHTHTHSTHALEWM